MRNYLITPKYFFAYPNPDEPEPKKVGFFTTKITKEKKSKKMNVEHRTLNIERRMWVSLRSVFLIKLSRQGRTIIRRWKFDVGRSFFDPVLPLVWNL